MIEIVFIGIVATGIFDLWGLAVSSALGTPRSNWGLAGRWFGHMPRRFRHENISAAPAVAANAQSGGRRIT